jgi:hypothetical protein
MHLNRTNWLITRDLVRFKKKSKQRWQIWASQLWSVRLILIVSGVQDFIKCPFILPSSVAASLYVFFNENYDGGGRGVGTNCGAGRICGAKSDWLKQSRARSAVSIYFCIHFWLRCFRLAFTSMFFYL